MSNELLEGSNTAIASRRTRVLRESTAVAGVEWDGHTAILDDLAVSFDGQYFSQIRRYYDELGERRDIERSCHDGQLDVFDGDDVASWITCPTDERRPPPRPFASDGRGAEPIVTTTTVIIAITAAPACASARPALPRLSDDERAM